MDFLIVILIYCEHIKTPNEISFLCIINRVLMVVLGKSNWIYGYIILYFIYSTVFIHLIARDYYPVEGEFVKKREKKDKLKNPVFLLVLISIYYLILMSFMQGYNSDGRIGITDFTIKIGLRSWRVTYLEAAALSIYVVACLYLIVALLRSMLQKI